MFKFYLKCPVGLYYDTTLLVLVILVLWRILEIKGSCNESLHNITYHLYPISLLPIHYSMLLVLVNVLFFASYFYVEQPPLEEDDSDLSLQVLLLC